MKKILFFLLFTTLVMAPLFSLQGEIVFIDGIVDLKPASGGLEYADIGMPVETGDSIITGYDGYAELELEDGSLVRVNEESIFKISSVQTDRGSQNSFQLVLGSAGYKFTKTMKEEEPSISTPSTVCGLRGTEFTVMAGIDGSALYVVDEGSVFVSSKGEEVQLGAEEGVRVKAGQAPGEVFEVLRGKVDYSAFKAESEETFLSNPATTVFLLVDQLVEYANEADKFEALFQAQKVALDDLRVKMKAMGDDDRKSFYNETVFPEEIKVTGLKHNVRYYAVSSMSLRRYVIGTMFVEMKTRYILKQDDPDYLDFMNAYLQFVDIYETRIVPYLVEADIE
ncbi:FecR family protein [Oceanispirochaeta sp.]|uniref:FecR family protein n=1 Tax=Oceanispirochaeta sp. TaxID=2035350 RepID=UPI002637372A|nr:FecR family protein [Oceanispirochaeta sp.]MDA3958818.1 FecR family protein [Oceanispirochaeta sp.]